MGKAYNNQSSVRHGGEQLDGLLWHESNSKINIYFHCFLKLSYYFKSTGTGNLLIVGFFTGSSGARGIYFYSFTFYFSYYRNSLNPTYE